MKRYAALEQLPGTLESLDSLPVGSIVADNPGHPDDRIGYNWRKTGQFEWTFFIDTEQQARVCVTDDERRPLAAWQLHYVAPYEYLIREEDEIS